MTTNTTSLQKWLRRGKDLSKCRRHIHSRPRRDFTRYEDFYAERNVHGGDSLMWHRQTRQLRHTL